MDNRTSTSPHPVECGAKRLSVMVLASTLFPQSWCRNPNKDRHLRHFSRMVSWVYVRWKRFEASVFRVRPSNGSGGEFGGGRRRIQGLRWLAIPVITPFQAGGASRVLHPPRSGASGCSANGWSATRSDSQRSHLTNQVGWAIRPGDGSRGSVVPYRTANQPTGGRQEKNGSVSYDLG